MNWGDLEDKPIPRKNGPQSKRVGRSPTGKKPRRRKSSTRIHVPTESDNNDRYGMSKIYSPNNQPKERGRSTSTRDCGNESDASRFSQDCLDGEAVERGRQKRKAKQKRNKEEQKKQQTIEQLKASQREKDSQQPECIDIDDHEDDRHRSPDKSTFDGVRTDRVTNVQDLEYVNSLKDMYPGNDNDDSVEVGEDRGKSSKRNKKNKTYRGNNHNGRSDLAVGGTPRNLDSRRRGNQNQGGRGRQHDVLNQSYSTSDDPLDQAAQIQEANRPRSSSKTRSSPYFDLHSNKTKNTSEEGNGLWSNVTNSARKCVNGVKECVKQLASSPSKAKRGKGGSMTQRMGNNMEILGNGNMVSKREQRRQRKRCGEAAQSRQDRGDQQPTSGEKRKREYMNDAIELDQSVCAVDESQEMKGSNNIDEEELEIVGAIEGASTHVSQADYEHLPTAKQTNFSSLRRAPEKKNNGKRKEKSYGGAARKDTISDFASHMKTQRRVGEDDIIDNAVGRASGARSKSRGRSPVPAPTDSKGWIHRNQNNVPEKSSSRTLPSRLKDQMKKQGMRVDDGDSSSRSKGKGKGQQRKGKGMHQTKLSLTPSSRNTRRRSRSKSQQPRDPKDDIIEIDDSSEEEDDDMSMDEPADVAENIGEDKPEHKWAPGERRAVDAVNIAIGKKMVTSKCELSVQTGTRHPYIQFSGVDPKGNSISHKVLLNNNEELKEIKYFIANDDTNEDADESLTMIAFRITPSEKNGFTNYPNKYHQDDTEDEDKTDKYYVSVEVRDPDALFAFVTAMEEHLTLKTFCEDAKVPSYEVPKYAQALIDHQRQERNARLSVAGRTRSGGNTNKKKKNSDNKLLLVYPFGVDESILDEAASELAELGGDLLGVKDARHSATMLDNEDNDQSDGGGEDSDEKKGKSSRTHYVTIREDDVERLSPGQFLNDTLVDFWMRWISRGEPADSNVHFFTSHFMTTLKEDGPEAVASWTAKKKINIFKKKFIFIPVNADLHWSLCVVVNPGLIANNTNNDTPQDEDHACILFLDSLRMHTKQVYARHIRKWLNFEWKRQKKGSVNGTKEPFDKNMVLKSPKIPYQENGCDCGVFVCRYAYNLYTMRHIKFTYDAIEDKFRSLVTNGPAFQFDMSDIARIRIEIGTLIDNLSKPYLKMREEEKKQERAKKAKRRENANIKSINQEATSENQSKRTTTALAEAKVYGDKTEPTPKTEKNASPPSETETSAMLTTTEVGGASSDTAMSTSDVDNGSPDTADEADSQKDAEEKENIVNQEESHDGSTVDGVSPQKLASDQQGMDEESVRADAVTSPLL